MHYSWRQDVWFLVGLILLALLLGAILGHPYKAVIIAMALYLAPNLRHLLQLHRWLETQQREDIPEASGMWGDVFDRIRTLTKESKQREDLLTDMLASYDRTGSSVVALKRFGAPEIGSYGVVLPEGPVRDDGLVRVVDMVEKPNPAEAPSDLAIMGRYLLTPGIFDCIARLTPGAGGELQLTDAMRKLLKSEAFYGLPFETGRYDTGNKLDWLRATVEIALRHPVLGEDFQQILDQITGRTAM